jgi:hypothetical protein
VKVEAEGASADSPESRRQLRRAAAKLIAQFASGVKS